MNIQALSDEAILLEQLRKAGLPAPDWRGTTEGVGPLNLETYVSLGLAAAGSSRALALSMA